MTTDYPLLVLTAVLLLTSQTFAAHFIIVGGGTSGLLLANRLSADPQNTVTVIEPGPDERNNPNITDIQRRFGVQNTPIDWAYQSEPQKDLNERSTTYHAGKLLGGTSMINAMMYVRPDAALIDTWPPRWKWRDLWPYFLRTESFRVPTATQISLNATWEPRYHGRSGDIDVCYPFELANGTFGETVRKAWQELGVAKNIDANGGVVQGFFPRQMTVQRDATLRESSATAFFYPVDQRMNLQVVRGTVTRIAWHESSGGIREKARGVEFITHDGIIESLTLRDPGEVILSAGSLRSPGILEASGIGDESVLERVGIPPRIDLVGVGKNLQDQLNCGIAYNSTLNISGITPYATFVTAKQLFGNDTAAIRDALNSSFPALAQNLAASGSAASVTSALRILTTQHEIFFRENVSVAEITTSANSQGRVSLSFWSLLPFSRGAVHIRRSNGTMDLDKSKIDPKFFSAEFDVTYKIAVARFTQAFAETETMKHLGLVPVQDLPSNASNEQWESFLRKTCKTNYHPVGTASMMSREMGGVVDQQLKLYGTENVRVVDASVLPTQLNGHMVATLYAVAMKAADLILDAS
ncbi:Glucose oxidase [Pseudocercospora fuligena]|uniref:Glucose oxidase n=1 Tax=Pseudocercospora fuligena TaxID=685502 RepID=A0A8H6R661_9PEZI|nr:Glucose oxidase [Pseudocercospora fuligena]